MNTTTDFADTLLTWAKRLEVTYPDTATRTRMSGDEQRDAFTALMREVETKLLLIAIENRHPAGNHELGREALDALMTISL